MLNGLNCSDYAKIMKKNVNNDCCTELKEDWLPTPIVKTEKQSLMPRYVMFWRQKKEKRDHIKNEIGKWEY